MRFLILLVLITGCSIFEKPICKKHKWRIKVECDNCDEKPSYIKVTIYPKKVY